jgi:hypothetical protein
MAEASTVVAASPSYGMYALFGLAVVGSGFYIASKKNNQKDIDFSRI